MTLPEHADPAADAVAPKAPASCGAAGRGSPFVGLVHPNRITGAVIKLTAGDEIPAHRAVRIFPEIGQALLGVPGPEERLGVAFDGAARGAPIHVATSGVDEVEAAAPIAAGAYVEVVDGGRIAQAEPKPGYQIAALGLALRGASAAGERVPVLISPAGLL